MNMYINARAILVILLMPFAVRAQHINYVDGWDRPNGSVKAIARDGDIVYIAGDFTHVGFQPRSGLAAVNMITGDVTSFGPNVNGEVRAIAVQNGKVYIGGYFTVVNGETRKSLAAFDAATGTLTSWNPKANGQGVYALISHGNLIYAGGAFSQLGPNIRKKLAAIDPVTGNPTSWDPDLGSNIVYAMSIHGNNIWVGGDFSPRAIALTSASPTVFTTGAADVTSIAVSGNTVYVAGHWGGTSGSSIKSFNAATGVAGSFAPSLNHFAEAVAVSGNVLYACGYFDIVNGVSRPKLAAFDVATGTLLATRLSCNSAAYVMNVSGNAILLGGHFTQMAFDPTRQHFMKVIDSLNTVSDPVSISASDTSVCAGGSVQFSVNTPDALLSYQWRLNGINIPGATTHFYTASSPAGGSVFDCMATGSGTLTSNPITVTVNTPSSIVISGSHASICATGTVLLSASPGLSYIWSTGAATQSITTGVAGSYQVTVEDSNGCTSHSVPFVIQQDSMLSIVKIKADGPATVCEPIAVSFVLDMTPGITAGYSYQWLRDNNPIPGATDSFYVSGVSGSIKLTVYKSGAGCSKTSTAKLATIKPMPTATFITSGSTTFCSGGQVTLTAPANPGYTYTWLKNGNVNVGNGTSKVLNVSGSYTVVATLSGCKDTASPVTVTVHPQPVATVSTSDPKSICPGDSVTLNGGPAGGISYVWKNGNATVATTTTPTYEAKTAGVYKLVMTDPNGCSSKPSTTQVVVTVKPLPNANITAQGATTIPSNGSVKLVASPSSGVTWQWYLNGAPISGATAKNYIATSGGDYTVEVTKQGCSDMSAVTTVTQSSAKQVEGVTSVPAGEEVTLELLAYPNPVNGILTIGAKGIDEVDAIVQVMDMNGRLVSTQQMNSYTMTIDMGTYTPGIYLLRYKDKQGRTGTVKIRRQ